MSLCNSKLQNHLYSISACHSFIFLHTLLLSFLLILIPLACLNRKNHYKLGEACRLDICNQPSIYDLKTTLSQLSPKNPVWHESRLLCPRLNPTTFPSPHFTGFWRRRGESSKLSLISPGMYPQRGRALTLLQIPYMKRKLHVHVCIKKKISYSRRRDNWESIEVSGIFAPDNSLINVYWLVCFMWGFRLLPRSSYWWYTMTSPGSLDHCMIIHYPFIFLMLTLL